MSVRPSIRPSVRHVEVPQKHRLDYFESKCTTTQLRVFSPQRHNIGNLVQGKHPQNSGGIVVGSLFTAENLQSLKRSKIAPKLLLTTNRKSHTRFRLVPKSSTLDD